MGDPLFERRTLLRNIHIDAKFLQRNIQASLLAQLRHKYEGICVGEGYVHRGSLTILEHSLGRTNLIKGGLDYTVKFQADICMPHPGQVFRVPVVLKSKIGVHAEVTPIKVLLPRDLHIGNTDFETVKEKEEIEFEVIGSRFQQGDESISVLGKLRTVIQTAKEGATEGSETVDLGPQVAAPTGAEGAEPVLKKVTVDVGATKAKDEGPRKRRIKLNPGGNANEPKPEGTS